MILLLLVLGCATRVPPHLFPGPILEPQPPEPIPYVVDVQDCPEEVALVAGEPAPHVDAEGVATCHAAIVPGDRYAELLLAEREAVFWRDMAWSQRLERERDQRECQAKHDQAWIAAADAQAQLRAARLSAVVGVLATAGACAAIR